MRSKLQHLPVESQYKLMGMIKRRANDDQIYEEKKIADWMHPLKKRTGKKSWAVEDLSTVISPVK